MAHFAKLNHLGHVIDVITVNDELLMDENGNEREETGIQWLIEWSNGHPYWAQTSYNTRHGGHINGGTPFRTNYARKGGTFDKIRNMFIDWKPFDGDYVLDETIGEWFERDFVRRKQHDHDTTDYVQPMIDSNAYYDWDGVNWTWVKSY
jgi:hypothetical protein